MKNVTWISLALLGLTTTSYANVVRDPAQTEIKAVPVIKQQSLMEDKLQQLFPTTQKQKSTPHYTDEQLLQAPKQLEELFLDALIHSDKSVLRRYSKLYYQTSQADDLLIDWANAIRLRDQKPNQAVAIYYNLTKASPDNQFIRYQLAETLYRNQRFDEAKKEFAKLKPSMADNQIDQYFAAIHRKQQWHFTVGAGLLTDSNLENMAKPGAKATVRNGQVLTYNQPRQKGNGIKAWFTAEKQWDISAHNYLAFESRLDAKHYWNNKGYDDVNAHLGFGLGYTNAMENFAAQLTPYINKRWYAGGQDFNRKLTSYANSYGANLAFSYGFSTQLKYAFEYDYGYERYTHKENEGYKGAASRLTNSLIYFPSKTEYFAFALDLAKKDAKEKLNAYDLIGARVTWGEDWASGLNTEVTLGLAKRKYREAGIFDRKQSNTEYLVSLALSHDKLNYAGFTPKLTVNYTKAKSNIDIYSYDKTQVQLDVAKSF